MKQETEELILEHLVGCLIDKDTIIFYEEELDGLLNCLETESDCELTDVRYVDGTHCIAAKVRERMDCNQVRRYIQKNAYAVWDGYSCVIDRADFNTVAKSLPKPWQLTYRAVVPHTSFVVAELQRED